MDDISTSLISRVMKFFSAVLSKRSLRSLNLRQIFTALKYKNFRYWFIGQFISLAGTWMQTAAQGFLVYELTQSSAYLGYVAFATGAPSCLFMFFGGVYADRIPRRKLILLTQSVMMVLAFTLAGLTFAQVIQPWHIIVLAFLLGVATAFDAPARLSFVLEMVDREDLSNAIALNSMLFNLGVLIGPAAAGIIYVVLGPAWCFTINGISYTAVILALCAMTLKPYVPNATKSAPLEDFKEGLRYAFSSTILRTIITLIVVMCLFGAVYMTLVPAWAVNVLKGDAATNGWLFSCRGLGAFLGALMIAGLGRFKFKGMVLTFGTLIFPLLLLIFATLRSVPLAFVFMVGVGWANIIVFNMINSLIQSLVDDDYRGRIISLYTLGLFGLIPTGSLLVGWEAELWGEPTAVILNAVIVLLFSCWVYVKVPGLRAQE